MFPAFVMYHLQHSKYNSVFILKYKVGCRNSTLCLKQWNDSHLFIMKYGRVPCLLYLMLDRFAILELVIVNLCITLFCNSPMWLTRG